MATDDHSHSKVELYESGLTVPSDSENYSANNELSSSTSSSPLILYKPPTFWGLLRGAAINLVLPFVNGLMLGFGELFAHEAAFRLGWSNTKVRLIRSIDECRFSSIVLMTLPVLDLPYLPSIEAVRSRRGGPRDSFSEEEHPVKKCYSEFESINQ